MDPTTLYVLCIIFVATLFRSTFGFGDGLIAVPLLSLFIPIGVAVPLTVLLSTVIAAFVVVQDRTQIHFSSAKWLVIFAMLGIPIGIFVLMHGNETAVRSGLGILLIAYSIYSLLSKRNFKLETDNRIWLFICGFTSGLLGGAYGLSGPPLVIYGNLRNWSAKHFRATLQAYFLPANIIGMLGYWYEGLWNSTVIHYALMAIPVMIPAIVLGRYSNKQLKDGSFLNYIHLVLIAIGVLLIGRSFN